MSHNGDSGEAADMPAGIRVSHKAFIRTKPRELYARLTSGCGWEKWFASKASIGGNPGDPIYFQWKDFGADHYTAEDHGRVVTLDHPRRFSFTWHPGQKETLVCFRFEPRGDGCMLSVIETGYADSTEDLTVALQVATGWGEALTLLKFFVEQDLTYGPVPR